jgi:predicted RNase H-like HicB family nuclease
MHSLGAARQDLVHAPPFHTITSYLEAFPGPIDASRQRDNMRLPACREPMVEWLWALLRNKKQETAVEIAFNVIVERDEEGFYVATVLELRGCHTQARSLDALEERIREAIDLCLDEQGLPASSTQ